ncbi:manganese-dependent inorganic pyrophosphatase [Candidatus Gracilibacteria bacterium]|nr:manganese-dependent inorganic pyrophosphatase [Candidatus Gracilibacteria bacterium]
MTQISVIGHKNPDTDCTLSAIIMADYLNKKGYLATPYIQGSLNKETLFLLEKYNIPEPVIVTQLDTNIDVCLVDHNEASQSIDNLTNVRVSHIVDHHKINFESNTPLFMRLEPLCSTASVLYKMYIEAGYEISQDIATMMLACIMSDSLLWKSSTTTEEDKVIAAKLQKITAISNLSDFAMPMFEAKSDLGDVSAEEIITSDYKIFEAGDSNIGCGTVETTSPDNILARKEEILVGMKNIKENQKLDFIMLSIVDIIQEINTTLVLDGKDSEIIETVFDSSVINNEANLGARLSRKKQIIPQLTEYFNAR